MRSTLLKECSLVFVIFIFVMNLVGQETMDHDQHEHSTSEIGISSSGYYFIKSQEFSFGCHLHYVYYFPHSKFGVGAGYERIFDEHGHNTFGVIGTYSPIDSFIIAASPGLAFEDGSTSDINFAMHIEATYGFELGKIHIGPAFGYAITKEDQHLSVGLHIGFGL